MTKDQRSEKRKVDEGKRGGEKSEEKKKTREEECLNSIYICKRNLSELFSWLRSGNARDRTTTKKTYQYLPQSLGLHLSTMLKIRINLCDYDLFRISLPKIAKHTLFSYLIFVLRRTVI